MKLVIISSSPLVEQEAGYAAYGPYIKEMEIWARYSDEVAFFSPIWKQDNGLLISRINFPVSRLFVAHEFNIKSFGESLKAFYFSFGNFYQLFKAMAWADHIHLRCPGNIGLMGCFAQIFFPGKTKTAKYAGNWDPNAQQPWSYKLQRWILGNTFLTKNMQVLVYGKWENQSQNIKSFFTATYKESDKIEIKTRPLQGNISALFVGTLSPGKRPLYAIQLIEALVQKGVKMTLSLYGHGKELERLQQYISQNQLGDYVFLKGNQSLEVLKKAYQESHFMVLPSESEGWPKVVAEAMFWGCLPIATKVSCVPNMLDQGRRGLLLSMQLDEDVKLILNLVQNQADYTQRAEKAMDWSRKYTLDRFEEEIKNLLQR